jgi:ABC-type hemin transport system substrate-binding protein
VTDLGREQDIVGRHAADVLLPPSIPVCGDHIAIDLESLQRVNPTHVFTQWGTRDLPQPYSALARKNGWTTRDCELLTLADIRREIGAIESLLPPPHDKAAKLVAALDAALALKPTRPALGRVLLIAGVEPPGALGPGSCHHEMLVMLGATPAILSGSAWIELANEDVKRLSPDAIIVFQPRSPRTPPRGSEEAAYLGDEAIARVPSLAKLSTPALAAKHIAIVDDPLCLTPSTAMIRVARQMGEVLDAWAAERK